LILIVLDVVWLKKIDDSPAKIKKSVHMGKKLFWFFNISKGYKKAVTG